MTTSRGAGPLKTYQLWRSDAEGSLTFIEEGTDVHASMLEPDAKLIWTVKATSWNEAQAKKHDFLGWAPYKPMDDK